MCCLRVGYIIKYAKLSKSRYCIMYSQNRSLSSILNEMVYYNNTGNISLKNHLMRNAELSHAVESLNISTKKRQKSQAPRHSKAHACMLFKASLCIRNVCFLHL